MRKILSLFVMLLVSIASASAAAFVPEEGAKYVLKHVNSGLFLGFQTDYTENNVVNCAQLKDEGSQFTITTVDGGYTLYCDAASEYMTTAGAKSWNPGHGTEAGNPWQILEADTEGQYYLSKNGTNVCSTDSKEVNSYIYTDKAKSVGGLFEIINVDDLNKTRTYEVVVTGYETTVSIAGTAYNNGGSFEATNVLLSEIEPTEVEEYDVEVSIEGTTITITYTQWPEWTLNVIGLPEEEMLGTGCFIKGSLYVAGSTFRASSVSLTDITDVAVIEGYTSKVSIDANNHTITVTYSVHVDPVLGYDDIDVTKAYYIYTDARGGITIADENDTRLWGTEEIDPKQEVSKDDVRQQFAFINFKNKYYLYSIGAGKFVNSGKGIEGHETKGVLQDDPVHPIAFADAGNGTVRLLFEGVAQQNFNLGGSKQMDICYWSSKDIGNSFKIYPVADFDPDPVLANLNFGHVTYVYTLGGSEYKRVETDIKVGEPVPAAEALPFTSIVSSDLAADAVATEEDLTVNVVLTEALPFPTDTYGLLFVHSNQTRAAYAKQNEEDAWVGKDTGATAQNGNRGEQTDAYLWKFNGSLLEGFTLTNKAAEATLKAAEGATNFSDEEASDVFFLAAGSKGGGFANLNANVDGKFFALAPAEMEGQYLNSQNDLKYWSVADEGSTFIFVLVEDINLDGTIDLNDVEALANCIVKGQSCYQGDLNGDKATSVADITELVKALKK